GLRSGKICSQQNIATNARGICAAAVCALSGGERLMELKDFQQGVLDTLDCFLDELRGQQAKAEKIIKANQSITDPDLLHAIPDFPKLAWERMKEQGRLPIFRANKPYSGRKDGM